jgi:hypothetical protein
VFCMKMSQSAREHRLYGCYQVDGMQEVGLNRRMQLVCASSLAQKAVALAQKAVAQQGDQKGLPPGAIRTGDDATEMTAPSPNWSPYF